jgi:hypothetical protein
MAKHDLTNRQISNGRNYVRKFCLWEKQLATYKLNTALNWRAIKAKKANAINLPVTQGVYAFVVRTCIANMEWSGYILYIGKTDAQTFRRRYSQYFNEPKKKKPRLWVGEMLGLWKKHLYYYYAEVPVAQVDAVERSLLNALVPPNNDQFPADFSRFKKEIYK